MDQRLTTDDCAVGQGDSVLLEVCAYISTKVDTRDINLLSGTGSPRGKVVLEILLSSDSVIQLARLLEDKEHSDPSKVERYRIRQKR